MYLFSDPTQLWKLLANGTLKNKERKWQPVGNWTFTSATEKNRKNETLIHIRNNNDNKTLGAFDRRAIANETFVKGKHTQLWKRGQTNTEGYFTLQNSDSQKFMTADSNNFELKGKCILCISRCLSMNIFSIVIIY